MARFSLQDAKPLTTPLYLHHLVTLTKFPTTPHRFVDMRDIPYCEAIGSLMYAALGM